MNIQLNYETRVRAESSITLPTDGEIIFTSSTYKLTELVIVAKNGEKRVKGKTKNGVFDISPLLFAGVLEISVHLIVNGVPAKKWDIVPIVLREVDNSLCAFDEIEELRARVAELEKKTTVIV